MNQQINFDRTVHNGNVTVPGENEMVENYLFRCTACGYEQIVKVTIVNGRFFCGSGADWCDSCEMGKPELVIRET